jgi:adenine-specific DNA-methyltransferase
MANIGQIRVFGSILVPSYKPLRLQIFWCRFCGLASNVDHVEARIPASDELITARFFGAARRAAADGWHCREPVASIAYGSLANAPGYLRAAHERMSNLRLEWREHAAAVMAAVQLKPGERARLGAYFTPPSLVAHVLRRLQSYGYQPDRHRIVDPAAGGAAFLAPLHGLIASTCGKRLSAAKALGLLNGIEINSRLAKVTRDLLAWRLATARGVKRPDRKDFEAAARHVYVADTLAMRPRAKFDVVVGNPPYARIGRNEYEHFVQRWPSLTDTGGYLNLSMAFVSHCFEFVKPGGLLSFVMPAGFIGGPSFLRFRSSIAAEVVAIDRIEKREGVFLDVIQDCVVLTMQRANARRHLVTVGSLRPDGTDALLGKIKLPRDGGVWQLPGAKFIATGESLADLGWKGKVGTVVPHRWTDRVVSERRGSLPLIWAAAIRPDGRINYAHMRKRVTGCRVMVDQEVSYVIRNPCLLVQRTSNRRQKRRINAALVDQKLLDVLGPFVTENHVITLTPPADAPRQHLRQMLEILNSSEMTALYDRICGTASVSVKTLLAMKLPILAD